MPAVGFDAATDWPGVLDALQAHVEAVEALAARSPAERLPGWTPPLGAGDLPADQVDRAAALLGRLDRLVHTYERAAGHAHHQLDFVRSATVGVPPLPPLYLDARC